MVKGKKNEKSKKNDSNGKKKRIVIISIVSLVIIAGSILLYFILTKPTITDVDVSPGTIRLYDDGTHGDPKAGDELSNLIGFPLNISVYEKDHEPLGKARVKITGLGVMNHDEPAQSPVMGITNSSGQVVINIDIRDFYSDTPGKTLKLTLTISKKGYESKKVQVPVELV